ncbi:hypothetical protein [Legionella gresilensis]|uniref:hypothetical protein n=1 Tax=Legionella gresilensis TaxID=91823 RepID=UPI001041B423|nr:hypothetical protein [Legionella gresilensis]
MPKVIPILFTNANPLTSAQVKILSEARAILSNEFGFDVQRSIISPVNDAYLKQRIYPKIKLEGKNYHRLLFTARERLNIARGTIQDAYPLNVGIDIAAFGLYYNTTPNSLPKRGYIESWEMLEHLQKLEIERSQHANIEPTLYVLVAGTDLANQRGNWNDLAPGIPFLLVTRKTLDNETGALKQQINLESPGDYLKKLGYQGNIFNHFKSKVFTCPESLDANLSSTQLAECKPEALNLMGDKAFTELVKILAMRVKTKPYEHTAREQLETAKASLAIIKKYALEGVLGENKKAIIKQKFPSDLKAAALLESVKSFCTLKTREHIDGLKDIKAIFDQAAINKTLTNDELVDQLLTFTKWKKSDSNLARFFHNKVRHRAPETEQFYQLLASLDETDSNSWDRVTKSINMLNEMDVKDTQLNL